MALLNSDKQYVDSTKYAAVAAWAALTVYAAGALVRQAATPTLGDERVFVCIIAGTSLAAEPTWVVTKGAKTAEAAGPTWQEVTGQPPVNGDVTNTLAWTVSAKNQSVVLGQIIKRDNAASYQICTTAGTCGNGTEPAFSDTAGVTTADNTVTWTSLGVVGGFGAFAAPHTRILNADASTWQTVVGSTVYLGHQHAHTQAVALTLAGGTGTSALPTKYLCVSNTVAPPTTVTTGASESTTGANALAISNELYFYGVEFSCGGGGANAANLSFTASAAEYFENCIFRLATTLSTAKMASSASNAEETLYLNNCSFLFSHVGQFATFSSPRVFINGGSVAATGSVPTSPFKSSTNSLIAVEVRGCDLSTIAGTLFTVASQNGGYIEFQNCKLHATAAMVTGSRLTAGSAAFSMRNCASDTKNYKMYYDDYFGTMSDDIATYNNAGATDGTTRISWKIVSKSTTGLGQPFITECFPIEIWQDAVGSSVTATVEIAGAATLTNAEIWMELEYLGSTLTPLATLATNRVANFLATPANVASSAASWAGSPAVTQKLQITFTPQLKGLIRARIFVGKASATVYIDPLITVT